MAEYVVTASDGRRYRVSGPEGVPEQVIKMDIDRQLARQDLMNRPAPPPPEPERTITGQAGEFFRGIPRGAVGLAETAATGIASILPDEQERAVRTAVGRAADVVTSPFQRKPGYEDSWAGTLGEGVGSTLPFFGAAALPGVAARIGAGVGLGSAAGAGEARTRAEEKGATAEERAQATALGIIPGAAEMLAPSRILNRFRKAVGPDTASSITSRLRRVATAAGEEGAQEAAAEIAQNLIARGVYDPEQGAFTNTGESFGLGAGVGGLIAGLMELAIPGRARGAGAPTTGQDGAGADQEAPQGTPEQGESFDDEPQADMFQEAERRDRAFEQTMDEEIAQQEQARAQRAQELQRQQAQERQQSIAGIEAEFEQGRQERAQRAREGQGEQVDMFPQVGAQQTAEPISATPEGLRALGVPARAAVIKQVEGKDIADPEQRVEVMDALRRYVANPTVRQRNPEARRSVMGLISQLEAAPAAPETDVAPEQMSMMGELDASAMDGVPATPQTAPGVAAEFEAVEATPETAPGVAPDDRVTQGVPVTPETAPGVAPDDRVTQGVPVTPETAPGVAAAPDGEPQMISRPKQESAATSEVNRSFARSLQGSRTNQELLGNLANDKLVPQPLRNLARQMRYAAPNVNVPVEMVELEGNDVVGTFVPEERGGERILLDPRADSVPQSFLHEYIHALTYRGMRQGKPAGRRINALYEQFKKKYPDVRNPETGDMEPAFYGLTDPFEFVSEGLTNAQFQSVLKRQNLWERFVDAIRAIVGLPSTHNKVIDELLDLTKELAVGADARAIAKRNEVVEAASMADTTSGAKDFMMKQGGELNDLSNPTTSQKLTRAVSNIMSSGADARRATLAWGLPLPALNDYVQSYVRRQGSSYVPFADSMKRFTEIALKSEGALRQFIDGMTAQLARMGEWRNNNAEKYNDFTELYFGGTEARVDITKPESSYTGEKLAAYKRLKKIYNTLGSAGQAIYRQMRVVHNRQFAQIKKLVYDRVYSETQNREMASSISNAFTRQLRENGPLEGYAPLVRPTGKYLLQYPVEGSEQMGFEIFENSYDRSRRVQQLEQDGVPRGEIKSFLGDDLKNFDGVVPGSFLGELVGTLQQGGASKELVETVMSLGVSMSPSSMVLKRLSQRRDVPGYTRDPFLAFQQSSVSLGKRLVNLEYGAQLNSEVRDMKATRENVGDDPEVLAIIKEITRRAQYAANPTQSWWSNWLTTATYGWTLGFNVSSSIVDFSSIALVTGPFLAKFKGYNYGYGKTYREMVKSAKDIMGMGTSADVETLVTAGLEGKELADVLAQLEQNDRDVVRRRTLPSMLNIDFNDPAQAQKYGHLQPLVAKLQEYGHSERFSNLEEMAEYGEAGALSKWSARMGFMMNASERLKREVGIKAAYELELQRLAPNGNPSAAQMEAAAQKAMDMSTLLNGGSTAITGAGFQQSDVGRIAFMYRRFAALQMYLQTKTIYDATLNDDPVTRAAARQFAAYSMLTSAAFVGLKGMPMMGAVATIWAIMGAVFGEDDEDNSFEGFLRRSTNPLLVEGVPNVLFNANVGQRMELTNLIYRDSNLPDDATLADIVIAHFGGPAAGTATRMWRGKQLIEDGQIQRGIESMLPASLASLLKSVRFTSEGAIETLRGDEVVPVTPGGALAQALGFAPADYARAMTFKTTEARIDRRMLERRSNLMEAIYTAYRVGDTATMARAMQKLAEFNARHPEFAVTSRGLRQSIATRDRNTANMIMGTLPSERRREAWAEGAREWGLTE